MLPPFVSSVVGGVDVVPLHPPPPLLVDELLPSLFGVVGVVGFDNLSDLPYSDITSVEYSKNSVVKQAIDLLVKKNNKREAQSQYIPGYLVIRRTSSLRKTLR